MSDMKIEYKRGKPIFFYLTDTVKHPLTPFCENKKVRRYEFEELMGFLQCNIIVDKQFATVSFTNTSTIKYTDKRIFIITDKTDKYFSGFANLHRL